MVPGHGLAVSQPQHPLRELGELMEKRGAEVRCGIHPVAGRMTGHMKSKPACPTTSSWT
jgi:NAD(P) transhydrogenase subunit beta